MRILHHANACFSIFHKDLHILCDPWIEGPAVAGGWTQFPPVKTRLEDLPKPDYVYISHIHSDHCEEKTLDKIDKSTPVIIMDLKPGFLEKMLRRRGFSNLIVVQEKKPRSVSDRFTVEVFPASFGHICANVIDSSVLFIFEDFVLLNCNDNKPSEELCRSIKERHGEIDLAFLPAGGGSGYPAMYDNLSADEKREITKTTVERYTKDFTTAVDLLQPKIAVPVAGGYAIRGPRAEEVNWFQARRFNQSEVADYYRQHGASKQTKVIPLQSGIELDANKGEIIKGSYHAWTDDELKVYFQKLAGEKIVPSVSTRGPVRNLNLLWGLARKNLWERQQQLKMFPEYTIYLDVETQAELFELQLDQSEGQAVARDAQKKQPYLQMTLDQDTALEWILGFEDFNMLDSGHRIRFWREPNQYVVEAYYLMSMFRLG